MEPDLKLKGWEEWGRWEVKIMVMSASVGGSNGLSFLFLVEVITVYASILAAQVLRNH